ncbi:MAG: hypothetical protein IPK82_38385 [Polyangiaceae bacterium]|nr:hypothetical protein [Polyangiaceae bacterium]
MAAWRHTAYWKSSDYFTQYRRYVQERARDYMGRTEDCADISVLLIINFAAEKGLPVTFTDGDGVLYCSKAEQQHPSRVLRTLEWGDGDQAAYAQAIQRRISSSNLIARNLEANDIGPQPGDLMIKSDHTALVFSWFPVPAASSWSHPKDADFVAGKIPLFPGQEIARKQLDQLEYFRQAPSDVPDSMGYIDYLNHRGEGKQRAELIYRAPVSEMQRQGLKFMKYNADVLRDWENWDGKGAPP